MISNLSNNLELHQQCCKKLPEYTCVLHIISPPKVSCLSKNSLDSSSSSSSLSILTNQSLQNFIFFTYCRNYFPLHSVSWQESVSVCLFFFFFFLRGSPLFLVSFHSFSVSFEKECYAISTTKHFLFFQ